MRSKSPISLGTQLACVPRSPRGAAERHDKTQRSPGLGRNAHRPPAPMPVPLHPEQLSGLFEDLFTLAFETAAASAAVHRYSLVNDTHFPASKLRTKLPIAFLCVKEEPLVE